MRTAMILVAMSVAVAGCSLPSGDEETTAVLLEAITLANHLQAGLPFEQDVFVERPGIMGGVYRANGDDAAVDAIASGPLYASADALDHDFTFTQGGPFAKGAELRFTLTEWLAASGSASYACVEDTAHVGVKLLGGVPGGVYTVWNFWAEFRGGAIVDGMDLPAGPADGSGSAFTADEHGNAHFNASWDECPEASTFDGTDGRSWGIALAYHSDGQTHGAHPGPFGQTTHVQLFGLAVEGTNDA